MPTVRAVPLVNAASAPPATVVASSSRNSGLGARPVVGTLLLLPSWSYPGRPTHRPAEATGAAQRLRGVSTATRLVGGPDQSEDLHPRSQRCNHKVVILPAGSPGRRETGEELYGEKGGPPWMRATSAGQRRAGPSFRGTGARSTGTTNRSRTGRSGRCAPRPIQRRSFPRRADPPGKRS